MSERKRKEQFIKIMDYLDNQIKLLPKLESKYIGISMSFPQSYDKLNMLIKSMERLKEYDNDVCTAVYYNIVDDNSIEYKKIVFLGNDYLHLIKISNFLKKQGFNLSNKDICTIYREYTTDINVNLKGHHSRITSLNDLFSMCEIQIENIDVGMGYKYKQINQENIDYCCHKDDQEGKELGHEIFIKSLEYNSRRLLAEGFILGYPAIDYRIKLINASCNMCFYREYYYVTGAHMSLKNSMNKANWKICEPLAEINLTCSNNYYKSNLFFKDIENINLYKL